MCVKNDAEKGWLLENLVFMALRRGSNKIAYYLNGDGTEVDFHVFDKVARTSRLVQVSWDMADKTTFAREFDAIVAARNETGITDCTIVTWDDEGEKDGIRIVPVWKWLLAN